MQIMPSSHFSTQDGDQSSKERHREMMKNDWHTTRDIYLGPLNSL
jgi:hypothetical protein